MATTDLAATGGYSFSAESLLDFAGNTELEVNTGFAIYGDCEIKSIFPTQLVADGDIGFYAPATIASILPTAVHFVAGGSLSFEGISIIDSVLPSSLVTALVAAGSMSLSSKGAIGDGTRIVGQTDFVGTGEYRIFSDTVLDAIAPSARETALAASGGLSFGCACVLDSPAAAVTALAGTVFYMLGGQATSGVILPSVTHLVATGGYILESYGMELEEAIFEAWVLNGQAFEPSIFSAFKFNSFAHRGAQSFAAGEEGIYLLGGDDDDGEAFHTGARIGPVNFGADREKRLRGIQMGNCGPDTKVMVMADGGEGGKGIFTPDIDSNRVVVSRDIQGREFTIDIQDFLELNHLETTVLRLARR
jgi:hypothetical protein